MSNANIYILIKKKEKIKNNDRGNNLAQNKK
jgi:hypothetical protein